MKGATVLLFTLASLLATIVDVEGGCTLGLGTTLPKPWGCTIAKGRINWQGDGNLVIYDENNKVKWASNSDPHGDRLVFQGDGNLVIYDAAGAAKWESKTAGKGDTVTFQDDRNLVVRDAKGNAVWASGTHGRRK